MNNGFRVGWLLFCGLLLLIGYGLTQNTMVFDDGKLMTLSVMLWFGGQIIHYNRKLQSE